MIQTSFSIMVNQSLNVKPLSKSNNSISICSTNKEQQGEYWCALEFEFDNFKEYIQANKHGFLTQVLLHNRLI